MSEITPTQELNVRRLTGRELVGAVKSAVASLASGDVLKVVATDPGSVADMAAFSRSTGHEIIEQSEGGGEVTLLIRRR